MDKIASRYKNRSELIETVQISSCSDRSLAPRTLAARTVLPRRLPGRGGGDD